MARTLFTLLMALWVATVFAAPTKELKKRTFKVDRIENPNYVADGRMAMKRAYLKFGLGDIESKPDSDFGLRVKAAGNKSGTENGETTAVGAQNDAQFLSPISVGGQKIIVNFDSGSSDLWVFNTNTKGANPKTHTLYDQKKSTTSKPSNLKFNISYGDGSRASGPVVFDVVDIGGSTVQQQAVGVPDVVSDSFLKDTASNGLVGLAFSKLNTVGQKTFFDNVIPDLSEPVYTAQLKGGSVGAYEFGIIDKTAFKGDLKKVDVISTRGFWEFKSENITVNGKSTALKGTAIADTGTSLMLVGDDALKAYWGQVKESEFDTDSGSFIFPCKTKLPDFQIAAGPHMTTVPGTNLNFALFQRRRVPGSTQTVDMCFGGLQSRGRSQFSIYGDVWFKSQFVAFQGTNPPSLGVAPHA